MKSQGTRAPDEGRAFPARPSLTPVFVCSLAYWALCAIGYGSSVSWSREAEVAAIVGGVAACAAGALVAAVGSKRVAGLVLAAAGIGLCLGVTHAMQVQVGADQLKGFAGEVVAELVEDSAKGSFGETALVRVRAPDGREAVLNARLKAEQPLLAGELYRLTGTFKRADYSRSAFSWNDGSSGIFTVSSFERIPAGEPMESLVGLRKHVIASIGGDDDPHLLLQALVCGYRRELRGSELYASFQTCGLAHLVAVSGAHLVIVAGLFASLLRAVRAPRRLTVCLLIAVMGSYFVVAGMPVSALRAAVMSSLGLLAFFGGRRASSLNAVGIAVFALIAVSPPTSLSASFALSGLSTAGIVLFAPLFQAWLEKTPLAHARFALEALSLTLSAALLSQLYACSLFSVLPIVSPLANVLAAPLFPIACMAGLVLTGFGAIFPEVAAMANALAAAIASLMTGLVSGLSSLPHASVPVSIDTAPALGLSFGAAFALWMLWPTRASQVMALIGGGAAALVLALFVPFGADDCIIMLDIGQGDAILVRSGGQTLLIDTGNQDSKLLEQLGTQRISRINTLLVSHADDDHCGSLDALRRAVEVDRIVLASGMLTCEGAAAKSLVSESAGTATDVIGIDLDDEFALGNFNVRVIWPEAFTEEGGNADSLCVLLEYDGNRDSVADCTALMTGDAEKEQLERMIAMRAVGDIDILKVGHHGSRNGATLEEMRTLSPEIALISCGEGNRYGHPTQETLDILEEVGAATYRTDQNGQVRCTLTPQSIRVECVK